MNINSFSHRAFLPSLLLSLISLISFGQESASTQNSGQSTNGVTTLPVNFGATTAFIDNNVLTVNWETLYETSNALFELEFSTDGIHFTKFGEVKSKAIHGNSDLLLQYQHTVTKPLTALIPGIIPLLVLGLGSFGKNRKKVLLLIGLIIIICPLISCSKQHQLDNDRNENKKLLIRIVQVDMEGGKSTSKIVLATQK